MTTTAAALPYPHIVHDPGVASGRPRIAGTRVRVMDVVSARKAGISEDQLREYSSSRTLSLSEVHAALAYYYYYDHQAEIDRDCAEDEQLGGGAGRERVKLTTAP